jgi:hypothetical protein
MNELDDVDWAGLEDAYGSAVELPRRLRSLALGADDWEACLDDLHASIYHQGSYYSATAAAVPFLVAIVDAGAACVERAMKFLADLSGGHLADTVTGWDPFTFRGSPAAPDYPEATAAVEAVAKGLDVYRRRLGDADAGVRGAAAHLLAGIAEGATASHAALCAALAIEEDVAVRASLLLAGARLGGAPTVPDDGAPALERAVAAVGRAWHGQVDLPRLLEAATLEPVPFAWEPVSRMAVAALSRRTDKAPLKGVIELWLERGGRLYSFHLDRNPWEPSSGPSPKQRHRDELLRAAMTAYVPHAFAEWVEQAEPVTVDQLSALQLEILGWAAEYGLGIPLAAIPWRDVHALKRFLAGDGPLDRTVNDRPLWRWLYALGDEQLAEPERDALIATLAGLEPGVLFEICSDIVAESYPHPKRFQPAYWRYEQRILELLAPHHELLIDRFEHYAEQLLVETRHNVRLRGAKLVVPALRSANRLREAHDPLLGLALPKDDDEAKQVLATIPEPRRSIMVGRLTGRRAPLLGACDPAIVARETVATFLAPECRIAWFQMSELLAETGIAGAAAIEDGLAKAPDTKRPLLERVWADISDKVVSVAMHVARHDRGVSIRLERDGELIAERTVPVAPSEADLRPLVDALGDATFIEIDLRLDDRLLEDRFRWMDLASSCGVRAVRLGDDLWQRRL